MSFRFLAVGPWAGWSQEAIEADIRRAQERAQDGADHDEEEDAHSAKSGDEQ